MSGLRLILLALVLVSALTYTIAAFVIPRPALTGKCQRTLLWAAKKTTSTDSFLLNDFKLANGETLDPYVVLKIPRSATKADIKAAYYALSRRYHPDKVKFRDILPGKCNNPEEVRDQWELIRRSYEILSNPTLRKRFDRHTTLADPQQALQRAATEAAVKGITEVGKGIFNMGAGIGKGIFGAGIFAFEQMTKGQDKPNDSPDGEAATK